MLATGAIQDPGIYADTRGGIALRDDGGQTGSGLIYSLVTPPWTKPFMNCPVRAVLDIDRSIAANERL